MPTRDSWIESAPMKIAVCVKAVPDAASGRHIDPSSNRLDRSGELTISEWDTYPVEEALKLKDASGGGEVVVVSMGPERAMDALRKALAMGADRAVLISDPSLESAGLLYTAQAVAGDRRGVGRDQHAALSVAEGDHGREEEAAGHVVRRRRRRRCRSRDDGARVEPAAAARRGAQDRGRRDRGGADRRVPRREEAR